MNTDLYAELGVPRDAPPETMRKAYRRRAKAAHPDAGGSPQAFAKLQLALGVLSDPERRTRYDATGEFEEGAPANDEALALEIIAKMLSARINGEHEPAQCDLVGDMRRECKEALKAIGAEIANAERIKARTERLLGRFKTKDGDQVSIMEMMLRRQISAAEAMTTKHRKPEAAFGRALELLEGWKFERDVTRPTQAELAACARQMNSVFSGSTSTMGGGFFR